MYEHSELVLFLQGPNQTAALTGGIEGHTPLLYSIKLSHQRTILPVDGFFFSSLL